MTCVYLIRPSEMTCVKHRAFRNGVFIRISEFMLLFQVAVGNHVCVL